MKYTIKPNYFFIVIALIIGSALIRQFNFEDYTFKQPVLAAIYSIVFIICVGLMIKKSKE